MFRARMSATKVPANLPELVRAKFNTAKANGDVNFYPTQVEVLKLGTVPVCLGRHLPDDRATMIPRRKR